MTRGTHNIIFIGLFVLSLSVFAEGLGLNIEGDLTDRERQQVESASAQILNSIELSIDTLQETVQVFESRPESFYENKLISIWNQSFKGNKIEEVVSKYETLQKKLLDGSVTIRLGRAECATAKASVKKVAFVMMLKNKSTGEQFLYDEHTQQVTDESIIYLCPYFFSSSDPIVQITSLLHEESHLHLETKDHKYMHEKHKVITPHQRLENADSYSSYTEGVLRLAKNQIPNA